MLSVECPTKAVCVQLLGQGRCEQSLPGMRFHGAGAWVGSQHIRDCAAKSKPLRKHCRGAITLPASELSHL